MESPGMGPPGPEALGDAVALAAGVAALVLALALAWVSTYVADGGQQLPGAIVAGGDAAVIRLGPVAAAEAPEAPGVPEPPEEKTEEPGAAAELGDGGGAPGPERPPDTPSSPEPAAERSARGGPPGPGLITVRFKFLNDTERVAAVRPEDTGGGGRCAPQRGVLILPRGARFFPGQESAVRFIYRGQLLRDQARTLRSLRVSDDCVIPCQRPGRGAAPPAPGPGPRSLPAGAGSPALPAAAVVLAALWCCRISYRQLLTAPATASLIGVTALGSLLASGLHRTRGSGGRCRSRPHPATAA